MQNLLTIAKDEWRFWFRSKLALWGIGVFAVLLIATGVLTGVETQHAEHDRLEHQMAAEERFLTQPARHPHRMVHYGHYVFRAPAPLAVIDPGLDAVTGQSMFLEGHRQNSAAFADTGASANLGGFSSLTPALVYQLFGPLLLVLCGYGSVVRERESGTLPTLLLQGVSGGQLLLGKWLALLMLALVLLAPLLLVGSVAESLSVALVLTGVYLVYFAVWAAAIVFLSTALRSRATVLATATAMWVVVCLLIPSMAVDAVSGGSSEAGKIQTELAMLTDLRKLGDGHNAADPAFASMRANLLAQYDVDRIEDLPVNFRGVVASYSEEKLTATLNQYAQTRLGGEAHQAQRLGRFGWLSPALAVAASSRAIAATDIAHYHRFLEEAEALRFQFVQRLNNIHAEKLLYQVDINRSNNEASSARARVSAENWKVLDEFRFVPAGLTPRVKAAMPTMTILAAWLTLFVIVLAMAGRRLKP
ncbi:MAG: ABC transporter permease [Woeseiaceae bacterium]